MFQSTVSSKNDLNLTKKSLKEAYEESRSLLEKIILFYGKKLGQMGEKKLEFSKSELQENQIALKELQFLSQKFKTYIIEAETSSQQ